MTLMAILSSRRCFQTRCLAVTPDLGGVPQQVPGLLTEVRRARFGPGLWPGPCRQARWAGRDSRVNGAPQARPSPA